MRADLSGDRAFGGHLVWEVHKNVVHIESEEVRSHVEGPVKVW
jgi:hypothetical protein